MKHSTTNTISKEDIRKALNDLLSPVDFTKVVSFRVLNDVVTKVFVGGEMVDGIRLNNLRAEAEFLVQSDLWKILVETPKELVQRSMFVSGETMDEMKKGRSVLYVLTEQQNIVKLLLTTVKK